MYIPIYLAPRTTQAYAKITRGVIIQNRIKIVWFRAQTLLSPPSLLPTTERQNPQTTHVPTKGAVRTSIGWRPISFFKEVESTVGPESRNPRIRDLRRN